MNLPIHQFPGVLVEAAATIPADHLEPGRLAEALDWLEPLGHELPGLPRDKQPVVFRLEDSQLDTFQPDMELPTPIEILKPDQRPATRFEILQLALASCIGQPLSIASVRDGAIIQDIFPTDANKATASSSYGSEKEFVFHNDLSFLDDPEIPDVVTLGCVRNTEAATTFVTSLNDILDGLGDRDSLELQKPQYAVRHVYHRGTPAERLGTRLSAAITPNLEIRLGVDMTPATSAAQLALDSLRSIIKQIAVPCQLQAGEVLVLPNRHTVHARDPFTMSPLAGGRRWLQRINIRAGSV